MVIGHDIGLADSVTLSLYPLVGRLSYKYLCQTDLSKWVNNNWKPILTYTSKITYLTQGWLFFSFKSPEDSTSILEQLWTIDDDSLMLKQWRISFDPLQDYFRLRHFWVLLPGLPLHLWNQKALEAIGNSLDRFICVDLQVLTASEKKVARVMVEIDIHDGLLECIDIDWRGKLYQQSLDYLGIPFRCTLYRKTRHLRNFCLGCFAEDRFEETMLDLSSRIDSLVAPTQPSYP
jgi:hypothetical protein